MNNKEIDRLEKDSRELIITHFADNNELNKGSKIFVKGEGCCLYDIHGNRYLDTFASLLTTICGHHRQEVDNAITDQLEKLEFFPNYVDSFTIPVIELARKLSDIMPGDLSVSMFVNSGSEANETAFKLARQYHWERGEKERVKILFRRHSYHGTTLTGSSATGISWFREYFEPLLCSSFIPTYSTQCSDCELGLKPDTCNLRCLEMIEKQIEWEGPSSIAAFIMDPLPGSNSGYPVPPDGYIRGIRELCSKYGIILIFDEVQTGFGKTGKMFVCEHWSVTPDIMTIGKGFSGGYIPLAAAVTTDKIADVFKEPGHEFRSGCTYGGHTVACAAALANIKVIEKDNLAQNAVTKGQYLRSKLEDLKAKYKIIDRISGMGLLLALFLTDPNKGENSAGSKPDIGSFIRDFCYNNGMIMRNNGNILVFAPALIITEKEIDEILEILEKALSEATEHFNIF